MFSGHDVSFSRGGHPLVYPFSFQVNAGEWVAVRGPNGSGKSSFLRLLAGLLPYTTGTFQWEGASFYPSDLPHRKRVAYMASPPYNACLPSCFKKGPALLKEWELDVCGTLPFSFLSQGQKQRLGLLEISLLQRPLWLLDEPTQHLDPKGKNLFLESLKAHLEKGGLAFIAIHEFFPFPPNRQLIFAS